MELRPEGRLKRDERVFERGIARARASSSPHRTRPSADKSTRRYQLLWPLKTERPRHSIAALPMPCSVSGPFTLLDGTEVVRLLGCTCSMQNSREKFSKGSGHRLCSLRHCPYFISIICFVAAYSPARILYTYIPLDKLAALNCTSCMPAGFSSSTSVITSCPSRLYTFRLTREA